MKWPLLLLFPLLISLLTGCSSVKLPNEATYGMTYRFQTDTERKILDGGFMPEILMHTNDWHFAVRTPNFTRTIDSETVEDGRDSWRANGLEAAYGKPIWQTDPLGAASARLNWELNGGVLIAYERLATDNIRLVQTQFGEREVRERVKGDTKYLPTAGVGLGFTAGVKTPGGGSYSSVGLGVHGGYRIVGEFGGTPYVDVGLVLGL